MTDFLLRCTFAAVPSATTWPPCSPAPGPMSTSQSALRIICSSCSTTITVLPRSRSRSSVPIRLVVVALVQADRRLVEDVEHADELAADLRREPQPLRLAAGQRRRRAVELQVADADVVEEREPLADLLHDARADQLLGLGQLERVEELERARDREPRELVDVLLADRDGEHLGLEPRALADRARPERHVLLDALALRRRVGLAVTALERRDDALEVDHVRAPPAHAVAVLHVDLVAVGAGEEVVLLLARSALPTGRRWGSRTGRRSPGSPTRRSPSRRPPTARARRRRSRATGRGRAGRGRSPAGRRARCSAGTRRAAS